MDPLSGLAVACAVTQFVDFGAKVLSKGLEISKSLNGASESNTDVEAITSDIENLSERISKSLPPQSISVSASQNDVALTKICQGCQDIAAILLARLKTLKAQKHAGKWEVFSKAFWSTWSEKEIKEMSERLETYRRQLNSHILVDLRESCAKSDLMNSESFKSLDQVTRDGIDAILKGQNSLASNHELQTSIITGTIQQEGVKTRSVLWQAMQYRADNSSVSRLMTNSRASAEEKFLATLRYTVMDDRYVQIKDSHEKTFEWIFREPKTTTRPWSNFSTWLQQNGQSIYWINGKAGSGKSTLMAFLRFHQKTDALLAHWSKDAPLLRGSFFFWNSGSPLQRTQNGMLRSLLHETLSKEPSLIPVVAPNYQGKEQQYWNDRALKEVFQNLCTQVTIPIKLFLLIDGLDEYEGDHSEIAIFLKKFSDLPNLKICVSSRPLPIFDLAFENSPSLQLQHLTFDDIQIYVHDRLLNNPIMAKMNREDEKDVQILIDSVATRAQGVFLWVVLVCTSLTNGLVAADQLSDLQKRVEACPKKLEELYGYMLQQIEPHHKEHSWRLFRIVEAAHSVLAEFMLHRVFSARELRFADLALDKVMAAEVKPLDRNKIPQQLKSLALCLKTRCAGLLELVDPPPASEPPTLAPDELTHVEYIHRTAREYLGETVSQQFRWVEVGSNNFDPYLALGISALMEIKVADHIPVQYIVDEPTGLLRKVVKALTYAKKTSDHSVSPMIAFVDEIDRVTTIHWKSWLKFDPLVALGKHLDGGPQRYSDHFDLHEFVSRYDEVQLSKNPDPESSMVTLAAKFGLLSYVKKKIDDDPTVTIFKTGRPLLDYAARPVVQYSLYEYFDKSSSFSPFLKTMDFLLENGCDPNETWHGRSPWETILTMAHCQYHVMQRYGAEETIISPDFLEMWLEIFRLFIDHGASRTAKGLKRNRSGKQQYEISEVYARAMILELVENLRPFITQLGQYEEGIVFMAKADAEVKTLLGQLAKNDGKTKNSKHTSKKIEKKGPESSLNPQNSSSNPKRASRICGCFG